MDNPAIKTAVVDCIVELVPPASSINLADNGSSLTIMISGMLSARGIHVDETSKASVSFIIATAKTDAFIRVAGPHGTCAQYFTRGSDNLLRKAGPQTIALVNNT
jgi:hypothetical protein